MNCNVNESSTKFLGDMMQGDMDKIYTPFLERMPEKAIILDAGCGTGRDSIYFKEHGHMVIPMDTSEESCQIAGERIGQAVLFCRFQDVHFKIPFDGIWACGSLIHLNNEELDNVLSHLYCYLRDGGTIYSSFIYGSYEGIREGEYYLDLNEEKAREIFTAAGYNVDKMWITRSYDGNNVDIKWLNVLANKKK